MITMDGLDVQWGIEKRLNIYDSHKREVIEGRILRAKFEGIEVLLAKEEFMKIPRKQRQNWAMIPMEPPWFWARGPISGPVTDMDDLITEKY